MFNLKNSVLLTVAFALASGLSIQNVSAGHGFGGRSHGGGGFNWRGAVNQALQGARHVQQHRQHNHSHHHYNPPRRHVQPQYHNHGHRQYVQPTYNPTPQRRNYVQPAIPHQQPVRQTYVVPQAPVHRQPALPQPNRVPVATSKPVAPTHVTPLKNVVPTVTPTPKHVQPVRPTNPVANSIPSGPGAVGTAGGGQTPASNRIPSGTNNIATTGPWAGWPVDEEGNPLDQNGVRVMSTVDGGGVNPTPETPAPAAANPGLDNFVVDLTQGNIDDMIGQINNQDLGQLDQATQAVMDAVDGAIDNLPNADQLSADDRRDIRDAIANGDPDAVRDLLGDAADTPSGQELLDMANAIDAIDDARDAINGDGFAGDDLADLIDAAQDLDNADGGFDPLFDLINQVAIDQQLVDWLADADPGFDDAPFGEDVPIVLVPGLPEGAMMPLEDGPVMIGAGETTDEVLLGTGNPAEVAGLPVAMPGEEPAAEAAGPIAAGTTILANPAPRPSTTTSTSSRSRWPRTSSRLFPERLRGLSSSTAAETSARPATS